MTENMKNSRNRKRMIALELALTILVPVFTYIFAKAMSFYEIFQMDKTFISIIVLVICLMWFINRRIREMKQTEDILTLTKAIKGWRIWIRIFVMLFFFSVLILLDEVMDLPHNLLGAMPSSINWVEVVIEIVIINCIGLYVFVKFYHSVTKCKQTEYALDKSEGKLNAMLQSIGDHISMMDKDLNIIWANDIAKEIFGNDIIGKKCYKVFHGKEKPCDDGNCLTIKAFRDGNVHEHDTQVIDKNGKILYFHCTANVALRDKNGNPTAVIEISRDITERMKGEDALHESEKFSMELIECMTDGFAILDAKGVHIDVNPALCKMTGFMREELIGVGPPHPYWSEDEFENIKEAFAKTIHGEFSDFELNFQRKNGERFPVIVSPSQIKDAKGNVISNFATIKDITEWKKAEAERERLLETLETKTKELEQIVYVFSHDLRSPLVNIQGFSKELEYAIEDLKALMRSEDVPRNIRMHFDSTTEDDISDSLGYIQSSIIKMDALLNGLLKLSRLGRNALEIKKLNMNLMIKTILDDFEFQIKENEVGVEISDLPSCLGDTTQMNLIFSNLISNALKYLDPKRAGIIKVSGYIEGYRSVYCIEDNGVGIAPEHHEKIFELFHQLYPDESAGDGLGLTIVKRILDRHFGKIWLESERGKGSKFFVSLPGA